MNTSPLISNPGFDTAVLVFSRNAAEEAAKKRYAKLLGKKAGNTLAGKLIHHTFKEARKTRLAVVPVFSDHQCGSSFGEKLANAIEQTFAAGFSKIIITGTDTPTVSAMQFELVAEGLVSNDLVLAPSADGGVYLIGIKKKSYNKQHFLSIPWLTDKVFDSFNTYVASNKLSCSSIAMAADIDEVSGLLQWRVAHPFNWLSGLLCQLLLQVNSGLYSFFNACYFSPGLHHQDALRGPPVQLL